MQTHDTKFQSHFWLPYPALVPHSEWAKATHVCAPVFTRNHGRTKLHTHAQQNHSHRAHSPFSLARASFSIRNNSHVETVGLSSRFSLVRRTSPRAVAAVVVSFTHTLEHTFQCISPVVLSGRPTNQRPLRLAMALFRITAVRFAEPQVSQEFAPNRRPRTEIGAGRSPVTSPYSTARAHANAYNKCECDLC